MEKEFDEEIEKIEFSLERFMKKKFQWLSYLKVDREQFIKNKKSERKYKDYIINVFITKDDFEKLKMQKNKNEFDTFEEQLSLLFNAVIEDNSKTTLTILPNIIE